MGVSPWRRKLSDEEIAEIHRLFDEGHTGLDISFMTGRSLSQIEKYNPNKKPRRESDRGRIIATDSYTLPHKVMGRLGFQNDSCSSRSASDGFR